MKNLRIAIVANSTWNIYNFRLNIIRKLLQEGMEVFVIAPLDEFIEYKERFPQVTHIPLHQLRRNNTNPVKDIRLIFELRNIYKRIQPDLVLHYTHKPNIFGGIAAGWSGIPSFAVVTGLGYSFLHSGPSNTLIKKLYRYSNRFHEKLIFENEDDLQLFLEEDLMTASKGKAIKGCGVDTAIYLPYANGQESSKMIFTFVGRLLYDKGIVEFVEAAKQLRQQNKNLEFWVVGELDNENPSMLEKSKLLEWIDKGYIVYHGFVRDVRPFIAKSNCIVLPSYREGMPRIIMEAMSMSKPVITTDTAGCRETVEEGINGYLVPSKNAEAVIMAIKKFIALSVEAQHDMGEAGRNKAIAEFNSEKIADELFEIISQN